jgi:hypothetical protein
MSKYTVYLLTTYAIWEDVEAKTEKEAIKKCEIPDEVDLNQPAKFVAIKEE